MTLYGQDGTLIDAGGGIASSDSCCCDVGADETPYPPPSGPDCGCDVFRVCTVQVSYDGLTVALPQNAGFQVYYKTVGTYTIWLGGRNFFSASIDRTLGITPRDFCNNSKIRVVGSCGVPDQFLLYHLILVYGANQPSAKNAFTAYFRYNIDALAAQPCPGEIGGRQVTVSEVARIPSFAVLANPADCGLSCEEIFRRFKAEAQQASPFGFAEYVVRLAGLLWSFRWSNLRWATYQGQQNLGVLPDPIRGDQQDAPDDELWPCDAPIWNVEHPRVSITCPP